MTTILGNNIKAYREAAGYSQAQLAQLCKISRQSLQKHENGKVLPTEETLTAYVTVLGVSAWDLTNNLHPDARNFKVFETITWS